MNWNAIALVLAAFDILLGVTHRASLDVTSGILMGSATLVVYGLISVFCADYLSEFKGMLLSGDYVTRTTPAGMFVFLGILLLSIPAAFGFCEFFSHARLPGKIVYSPPAAVSAPTVTQSAPNVQFASLRDAELEVVRKHPEIGIAGTKLNAAFIQRYHLYQQVQPRYFADNSWPVRLAAEVVH